MKNILYKCIASTATKPQQNYIGISKNEWKKQYYNHRKFRNKLYKSEISLSSYARKIKEIGQIPTLTWTIATTVSAYSNSTNVQFAFMRN